MDPFGEVVVLRKSGNRVAVKTRPGPPTKADKALLQELKREGITDTNQVLKNGETVGEFALRIVLANHLRRKKQEK